MAAPNCSRCLRLIDLNDTVAFDGDRIVHLDDRSDLLIREAEAAVAALRETMRMIAGGRE